MRRESLVFVAALGAVACGSDDGNDLGDPDTDSGGGGVIIPGTEDAGAAEGTLDGRWRAVGVTCQGRPKMLPAGGMVFAFSGDTGMVTAIVDESCSVEVAVTVSYPAPGEVVWIIGALRCVGECFASTGCPENTGLGDRHEATFEIAGSTLTLTEEVTPEHEYDCSSMRQVGTFERE